MGKDNESPMMYSLVIPGGREVKTMYLADKEKVLIGFSRRLTPEFMEEYRSIADLNRDLGTNFSLSKNKRSVLSFVPLSKNGALALRDCLNTMSHEDRILRD